MSGVIHSDAKVWVREREMQEKRIERGTNDEDSGDGNEGKMDRNGRKRRSE